MLSRKQIADWEFTRNQRILQSKLEAQERSFRDKQSWIYEQVQYNLGIDKYSEQKAALALEVAIAAKEKQIYEAERIAARAIAIEEEKRQSAFYRSPTRFTFPFQLTLNDKLSSFLDAQLMSSSRAVPLRAEILEAPKNGNVQVCTIFSRNGSNFADVFVLPINEICFRDGISKEQVEEMNKMDKGEPQAITYKMLQGAYIDSLIETGWDGSIVKTYGEMQKADNVKEKAVEVKKPFRMIDV